MEKRFPKRRSNTKKVQLNSKKIIKSCYRRMELEKSFKIPIKILGKLVLVKKIEMLGL